MCYSLLTIIARITTTMISTITITISISSLFLVLNHVCLPCRSASMYQFYICHGCQDKIWGRSVFDDTKELLNHYDRDVASRPEPESENQAALSVVWGCVKPSLHAPANDGTCVHRSPTSSIPGTKTFLDDHFQVVKLGFWPNCSHLT